MSDKYVSQMNIGGNLYKFRTGSVGTNADTVDGKHASEFLQNIPYWSSGNILDLVLSASSGAVWISAGVTGLPTYSVYWFGVIEASAKHRKITITAIDGRFTYIRAYNAGAQSWSNWINIADGGNADTVDGKHASDFVLTTDSRLTDSRTPKAHNQASNTINAMTSYSKPSATSAIAATDTLNAAIGKLEKALDDKAASSHTHSYLPFSNGEVSVQTQFKSNVLIVGRQYNYLDSDNSGTSFCTNHYLLKNKTGDKTEHNIFYRNDMDNNIAILKYRIYEPANHTTYKDFDFLLLSGIPYMRINGKNVVTNYSGTNPTTVSQGTSATPTGAEGTIYFQYS